MVNTYGNAHMYGNINAHMYLYLHMVFIFHFNLKGEKKIRKKIKNKIFDILII